MSYITMADLGQAAPAPSDAIIAQAQASVGASNVIVIAAGQATPAGWTPIALPDGRVLAAIPNVSLSLTPVGMPCPAGLMAIPVAGTGFQICVATSALPASSVSAIPAATIVQDAVTTVLGGAPDSNPASYNLANLTTMANQAVLQGVPAGSVVSLVRQEVFLHRLMMIDPYPAGDLTDLANRLAALVPAPVAPVAPIAPVAPYGTQPQLPGQAPAAPTQSQGRSVSPAGRLQRRRRRWPNGVDALRAPGSRRYRGRGPRRTAMRRNSDESVRGLERRAEEGDRQAALALWREQNRLGIERKEHDSSVFIVETPLGEVAMRPYDERTIRVEVGERDVAVGSGPTRLRQKITLPTMTLNRIPCRGYVQYHYFDEARLKEIIGDRPERAWSYAESRLKPYVPGFAPYSADLERGRWDIAESMSLKRVDRNHGFDDASDAAKARLTAMLTPLVNQWATVNKKIMLEAEAGSTSNQIIRQRGEYEKALEALRVEETELADLVIHEAQVRSALRR